MKKQIKWLTSILLIIGIVGYFIYASVKPIKTEVLEIQPQALAQSFKEEGIVTSAIERPVYSLINGTIKRLLIDEGQELKQGDLLIEIEAKELEYQLNQLKGQLESIEGQKKQANKSPYNSQIRQQQLVIEETKRLLNIGTDDYNKIKQLYDNGAVSKTEVDSARSHVEQLENNLKQQEQALRLIEEQTKPLPGTAQYFQGLIESIEAQIEHLEYKIANKNITSPINGIVSGVYVKEGAMVTPQTPLMGLTTDKDFKVEVYLLTEDVLNVKEGMKVTLIQKRKNGDYEFSGTVKAIAPAAEEKISALGLTQQKVKVTIAPDDMVVELRSGYALDVSFTTLEQKNKLVVPKVVLFPYEDGDALWVVKGGKAIIQRVEKGMETDEMVVIEKGLKAGDQVIKNPQLEGLAHGKKIKQIAHP